MAHEQRIYLRQLNPNPLFTAWLEEWHNLAENKNSLKKHSLAKALESIRKYPLVFYTGRDCSILDGFGQTICRMLDKKLEEYKKNDKNVSVLNEYEHNKSVQTILKNVQIEIGERSGSKRLLSPSVRTHTQKNNETDDLEDSIMKLFKKYDEIDNKGSTQSTLLNLVEDEKTEVYDSSEITNNYIEAGTFEIILLIDTQETIGKLKRNLDATIKALETHNVKFEVRHLSVGDFLWIARCNETEEYVLPYIVERKRMDDLACSIRDGRFHEQKFRLQDSGISNIIYMVESRGNNLHLGIPLSSLLQAATNTQVQNDFIVKFTDSHEDSMIYLSVMTTLLLHNYGADKSLRFYGMNEIKLLSKPEEREQAVLKFTEFNEKTIKLKNFKISQLFLRQLLQLKTLSLDKAVAILKVYPTPVALFSAYDDLQNNQQKCELLLAKIEYGNLQKQIGPTLSKCIYYFYYTQQSS